MRLRAATREDWAKLYAWRNDPVTKAMSLQSDTVALEDHLKWLDEALDDKNCLLFIAYNVEGDAVGTGRVERLKKGVAEVSLTIAPSRRGQGYGPTLIGMLIHEARQQWDAKRVIARVKQDNYASLVAFADQRFVVVKTQDGLVELKRDYQ